MNVAFFVASDEDDAAAARSRGPHPDLASVTFWNADFHPDFAVLMWESWLVGVSVEDLKSLGQPHVVELPLNDGYAVFVLSVRLLDALAAEGPNGFRDLAVDWVKEEVRIEGPDAVSLEAAVTILESVAALCRIAAATSRDRVYYWRG